MKILRLGNDHFSLLLIDSTLVTVLKGFNWEDQHVRGTGGRIEGRNEWMTSLMPDNLIFFRGF